MNELLKKLLAADVLTEDVKEQLEKAISTEITEAVEVAKAEAQTQVRAELKEQWNKERDALIEAIDSKVSELLVKEIEELKEDISRFRDLEAEYAEKLVESRAEMKQQLQEDIATLVEKLDAFLEMRLAAEIEELKEDMNKVKKLEFGRNVFEAFVNEYRKNFVDGDETERELKETRARLAAATKQLKEAKEQAEAQDRAAKLEKILSPLSGKKREVMETILSKLPTDQLEEGYKTFVGRVVRENEENSKEKETTKVLAEDISDISKTQKSTVKTGDAEPSITAVTESVDPQLAKLKESMRRLAGLDD